jgi:transcriptional regulator with XRE-family HTH domain
MDNEYIKHCIADNLLQLRRNSGITQKTLAEKAGLDQSYVSRMEHGDAEGKPVQWVKLAHALGVPVAHLFQGCDLQNKHTETPATPVLTLDVDGYPTDNTLDIIQTYPGYQGNWKWLMEAIAPLFCKHGRWESIDGIYWQVATGGWSGNESIIRALQKNTLFWSMCWQLSKKGGYYEFKTNAVENP